MELSRLFFHASTEIKVIVVRPTAAGM